MIELNDSLKKTRNTAEGENGIAYESLKQLPCGSLEYLFSISNNIWIIGNVPEIWKQGAVIPNTESKNVFV